MSSYETADVAVRGGSLRVGVWSAGAPRLIIAIHGITANHLAWRGLAELLPDVTIVAPDLRGRGRSGTLPGPWGMAQHAEDIAAVIRAYADGPATVVGHSMGGFVATALTRAHPGLVDSLVLVDGGIALPPPPGDLDTVVEATLGPALARLSMTFPSVEAHRDFWRDHPALRDDWSADLQAYLNYDLVGSVPELRSSVSADAVRQDSRDLYGGLESPFGDYPGPVIMLTAPRGLLDQTPGLYPPSALAGLAGRVRVEEVADVNHYTLLMGSGTDRVAAAVRSALG